MKVHGSVQELKASVGREVQGNKLERSVKIQD